MCAKKREKPPEVIYLILSLLVILVLLIILWRLYYRQRSPGLPAEKRIERPLELDEALTELELLRHRHDFSWPANTTYSNLELLEYSAFSLGYHEAHEQAAWVAYLLPKIMHLMGMKEGTTLELIRGFLPVQLHLPIIPKAVMTGGILLPQLILIITGKRLVNLFL